MQDKDEIRLSIPASAEFLRLARLIASGLASRLNFTYEAIEDLRLAVDELCYSLISSQEDISNTTLDLSYLVKDESIEIKGILNSNNAKIQQSQFSKQILSALVNSHEFKQSLDGKPSFWMAKSMPKAPN